MSTSGNPAPGVPVVPVDFPAVEADRRSTGDTAAAARARAQGHALGYAEGLRRASVETAVFRAGLEAEHATLQAALEERVRAEIGALAAATAAIAARTAPVLDQAERTLFDCALGLARAILGREIDSGTTAPRAALERALSGPLETQPLRVRMNPVDVEAVAPLVGQAGVFTGIDVVADPTLPRGDAVADFPDGFLDARLSSAFERARQALLEPGA